MWGGLPCIYMRILWKEVFNPIHLKTLFVYPTGISLQSLKLAAEQFDHVAD